MKLLGGRAHLRGVSFQSTTHVVYAERRKDGSIFINVKKLRKFSSKFGKLMLKLPFLRGLYVILNNILQAKKLFLLLILVSLIIEFFPWHLLVNNLSIIYHIEKYILLVIILVLMFIVKITRIGKYHGAEHKTFNAFQKNKFIDMANVKRESRVAARCGTNLLIFVLFIMLLLEIQPFYDLSSWSLLIGILLGYEIFRSKNRRLKKIFKPIYFLGSTVQYYLFTSEPTAEEIEVAIQALKVLGND